MLVTAAALGLLAVTLLGPVSYLLPRARWAAAEPRATLVLWQSVGLSAGLAVLGAVATVAVAPLHDTLFGALRRLVERIAAGQPTGGLGPVHTVLLAVTLILAARLLGMLVLSMWRTLRARGRHRRMVDIVGRPLTAELAGRRACRYAAGGPGSVSKPPAEPGEARPVPGKAGARAHTGVVCARGDNAARGRTRAPRPCPHLGTRWSSGLSSGPPQSAHGTSKQTLVLDHPAPAAYCLPGGTPRVVLTSGALALFDDEELAAVLAHEHAHLTERHDLVVLPFAAFTAALSWLPTVRQCRAAVDSLVEMVADDRACARCERSVLACALARFGTAGAPAGALAAAGAGQVTTRVHRLLDPPARSRSLRIGLLGVATALLALPTAALVLASV